MTSLVVVEDEDLSSRGREVFQGPITLYRVTGPVYPRTFLRCHLFGPVTRGRGDPTGPSRPAGSSPDFCPSPDPTTLTLLRP